MHDYFYSTRYWKIGLCEDQRYFGYLIIKTIEGRPSLPEITEEEQKDFFLLIGELESFYKQEFGATMFNYSCLMNHSYRDNVTPHVHFHFRPRYKTSVKILGEEFHDPNFGEHYLSASLDNNGNIPISGEVRSYVIEKLRAYLSKQQ